MASYTRAWTHSIVWDFIALLDRLPLGIAGGTNHKHLSFCILGLALAPYAMNLAFLDIDLAQISLHIAANIEIAIGLRMASVDVAWRQRLALTNANPIVKFAFAFFSLLLGICQLEGGAGDVRSWARPWLFAMRRVMQDPVDVSCQNAADQEACIHMLLDFAHDEAIFLLGREDHSPRWIDTIDVPSGEVADQGQEVDACAVPHMVAHRSIGLHEAKYLAT